MLLVFIEGDKMPTANNCQGGCKQRQEKSIWLEQSDPQLSPGHEAVADDAPPRANGAATG